MQSFDEFKSTMEITKTTGKISFLKNDPLYCREKPYLVLLPPSQDAEIDKSIPRSNLLYEYHLVDIGDVRGHTDQYQVEECGFQYVQHRTSVNSLLGLHGDGPTRADVDTYKVETENLLKDFFQAEHVVCYDLRVCHPSEESMTSIKDVLMWILDVRSERMSCTKEMKSTFVIRFSEKDLPLGHTQVWIHSAVSMHSSNAMTMLDVTARSGPEMILNHLSPGDYAKFRNQDYRFRIVK